MPFLLLGCGERHPTTTPQQSPHLPGADELHPGWQEKRGQDAGPNDISPFLFPTHTVRPPARDPSGPGTVRSTPPGCGQWQGVGWADLVLAALKLMPRFWQPPEAKPGSAAARRTDSRKELGWGSQPRTLLRAAGHPLLRQVLLEHLPVPGAVQGSEDSAGKDTQSCACGACFVPTSLCVERLHQQMSTGVNPSIVPFSMSERLTKLLLYLAPAVLDWVSPEGRA